MRKLVLFLVSILCVIPITLMGQNTVSSSVKLKPEQMTARKAKGLYGNVKTVTDNKGESISFNQLGNIISIESKEDGKRTYSYSSPSQYTVDGYGPYKITFTDNSRIVTDTSDPGVPDVYTFDNQGRLMTHQFLYYMSIDTETYKYKGSEKLPSMMIFEDHYETGEELYTNSFENITIDAYGNWTKRKVTITQESTEYVENGKDKVTTETKTFYETRTITYYPDTDSSSSIQPAAQQLKSPSFPGGNAAMVKFFADNANPQLPAIATAGYGEIIVEFTVTESGAIENADLKGKVLVSLDNEALRLVRMMPKWNPGLIDGQPSKMKVQVGIRFLPNRAFRYIKAMLY